LNDPYTERVAHIEGGGVVARDKTTLGETVFDEDANPVRILSQTWSATARVRMICMIVLEKSDIVKYPLSPPSEGAWDGG
jgi:hypothetical protein